MKKITALSLLITIICSSLFLVNKSKAQTIEGWYKAGNKPESYVVGIDKVVFKSGGSSAYIASAEEIFKGFGTLMQSCNAREYLGKRIKMIAYIKAEKVSDWAGMWLRVDSKLNNRALSFDNMQNRAIKGDKDWTKCEIVLDVPEESGTLNFGILLSGNGKVWFDNISFEIVDKLKVKTTESNTVLDKPSNVDFEE